MQPCARYHFIPTPSCKFFTRTEWSVYCDPHYRDEDTEAQNVNWFPQAFSAGKQWLWDLNPRLFGSNTLPPSYSSASSYSQNLTLKQGAGPVVITPWTYIRITGRRFHLFFSFKKYQCLGPFQMIKSEFWRWDPGIGHLKELCWVSSLSPRLLVSPVFLRWYLDFSCPPLQRNSRAKLWTSELQGKEGVSENPCGPGKLACWIPMGRLQ